MKVIVLILFLIFNVIYSNPSGIEMFNNLTKIKLQLNNNSNVTISENYFKRFITVSVKNPPADLTKQIMLFDDNNIEKIEVLKDTNNEKIYNIYVSLINFFYDYTKENNDLFISIGQGRMIIPLKTNDNLIFVPYIFETEPYNIEIEKLKIDYINSTHKVAEKYNNFIRFYNDNKYEKALKTGKELLNENIDTKSLITIKYLISEIDFYLNKEDCVRTSLDFKKLTEDNPNHPFNDRATVFIYKCYISIEAVSDVVLTLENAIKNYTNSPYYYDFLYSSALTDLDNNNDTEFKRKMNLILTRTKDNNLKFYTIYKLYRYYFEKNDLIEGYNIVSYNYEKSESVIQNNPFILTAYGDSLFYYKKFDKAKEIYEQVLKLTPNKFLQTYIKVRIADTDLYQYNYTKAIDYYEQEKGIFAGDDVGSILAKIRMAELEGNDFEKILKTFNDIELVVKESVLLQEILFRKGQIYFYQGDYIDSYFSFKRLLGYYPNTTLKTTAKQLIDRSVYAVYYKLFFDKNYVDVFQLYKDNDTIFLNHPEYYNLVYMIITSMYNLEQYKELSVFIDGVLKTSKKIQYESVITFYLAKAYLALNNFFKSKEALNYLVFRDKNFKNNYNYFIFWGDYYWDKKDIKQATEYYEASFKFDDMPINLKINKLNKIAKYFFNQRAYSPALSKYLQILDICDEKTYKKILFRIGQIYYYMKDYYKSKIIFKEYFEKYKENLNMELRYKIAMSYIYDNDYEKGVSLLKNIIKEELKEDLFETKELFETAVFWKTASEKALKYQEYKKYLNELNELPINKMGL